ncbi:MAG: hypothetical protein CEO19_379 [Parcubacteria group bacterium Gr01-1014_73]|nr:MAG: hypothetical protein CEO19_379 [Parcubacteria group bacterium Gr01-1014_73]
MNKKIILYFTLILLLIGVGGYFFPTSIQVTRINTDIEHRVSANDLATARELFQRNNIEMGTLAIVQVTKDRHGITHVGGAQFYNGLPVFSGNITYHFDQSGKTQDRSIIDGTNAILTSGERIGDLGISTGPSISASTAARKAREKMKSNYFFTAELRVLDLNAGTLYAKPNFVLAWRVMPKRADKYPYAEIDANNGSVLRYDDGIRY